MQVEYLQLPGAVDSLSGMVSGGKAYGRLRSHAFAWQWQNENPAGARPTGDNDMWGVGGSLVLKSGVYHGFSTTLGAYASLPLHDDNRIGTVNTGRSGKDTYHTRADGTEEELAVLAEASLQYQWSGGVLRAGRQLIDTLLVGSNDVKMVPNSYEALVFDTRALPGTRLQLGVIDALKNRDRESFHSLIAFQPREENDDGFAHRGLTPASIRAAGAEVYPELWFASLENRSLPDLRLNAEYYALPDYFATLLLEANYTLPLAGGWTLTPGIRWLGQYDDGAGAIGGAALSGTVRAAGQGYRDPDSVDGQLLAMRAVFTRGPVGLTAGWSTTADEADLIAPWR
ncbi:MAG: OprD family outer membrane porin, partial [Gammaproteobacteria bacterium]